MKRHGKSLVALRGLQERRPAVAPPAPAASRRRRRYCRRWPSAIRTDSAAESCWASSANREKQQFHQLVNIRLPFLLKLTHLQNTFTFQTTIITKASFFFSFSLETIIVLAI